MATYTLSAADPLLKDFYVGPIVEQLNYKTWMIDQIERDSEHIDLSGRRAIVPVHVNKNRGRGSRGDNANLPVAGFNTDVDAIVKIKYHYYAMEISDPTITATQNNAGAFANLLERESSMLAKEMRKDINRQVYGDGTGALAKVRAASTLKVVNVDSVQYIGVGDVVDVLVASSGATTNGIVGATVIKRTTGAEPTIELDVNLAGSAGTEYSVYITGSRMNEMDGLRNIIAKNRELHGINGATAGNEYWNAKVLNAEGNVAGESLFETLMDEVGAGGNGDVEAIVTTRGIKRRLADTYQSQKRFNDSRATEIKGGYTAIWVNEVPVISDDDAPKGFAFGINKDSFRWFEQAGPGWLEKDGVIFHLKNSTTAGQKMNVWQAWFKWYASLGNTSPNRNGVIEKAQDDVAA
jgi:hypothetical protein